MASFVELWPSELTVRISLSLTPSRRALIHCFPFMFELGIRRELPLAPALIGDYIYSGNKAGIMGN